MSKHTASSALTALVLATAVFVVAFALMMFVGEFSILGSMFLAFMVALLAGIVLFIGFGTSSAAPMPAARAAAPATPAAPPAPASSPADDQAAADTKAAADAEEARQAEAARQAEMEAARRAAEEKAERERAEAERRRAAEEAAATAATAAAPVAASAGTAGEDYDGDGVVEGTDEGTRPAGLDGPRDGKADDLKQIKGVGPKMEKLCNSLGFWHFDQIASWTADEVAWVDANLEGFKGRVTRDEWVSQARILAEGGETEFSKRVEDGDVY